MEAEATKRESQFRLWHLFALTAWVAVGAAAWSAELPAFPAFVIVSLAGAVALAIWIRMRDRADSRFRKFLKGAIAGAVFFDCAFCLTFVAFILSMPALMSALTAPPNRTPTNETRNTLRQLAVAVYLYEEQHGPLPRVVYDENGRPMHSWRVLILPIIEEPTLYKQYRFEEPWNSPHNLNVAKRMPHLFAAGFGAGPNVTTTDFLALYDPADSNAKVNHLPPDAPPLMLLQVADSGILWTEPRDMPLDGLPKWQATRTRQGGWICVTKSLGLVFIEPHTKWEDVPP